jgi:hypothetical protein
MNTDANLRNPYVVALLNPLNLAMLALVFAAGLCSAWWLFPIGLVIWAIMLVLVARQPVVVIGHTMDSRQPLAPRFQTGFDRIEKMQVNIFQAVNNADRRTHRLLLPLMDAVNRLTDTAYALCLRSSALENYRVVSQANQDLNAEWVQLSQKIEAANDPKVKQDYEQSRDLLMQRIQQQKTTVGYLDGVEAQMTSLASTLEATLAEMLRLQALGYEQVRSNRDGLLKNLQQQIQELQTFKSEQVAAPPVQPPTPTPPPQPPSPTPPPPSPPVQ